ncbi:MAG: hypothetical protein HY899_15260 [Deltaproteobacteria bacterium]|nr:hypothetical protein [Deltaproteobacteria bacterium]
MNNLGAWRAIAASLALTFVATACTQTTQKREAPVFFPPPPALPRIQYLTYFTGVKDIEEQSSFNRFIVGEKENRQLNKPYGIALYDGKIYVCDVNATVTVFDLQAKSLTFMKGATSGGGVLQQPVNISVAADGTKYVSDPVRGQVVAFDRNDEFLLAFGAPGGWKPVDAVPFDNRLYVADMGHGLVSIFDRQSGELLKSIGNTGDPSERLDRPSNLAFDSEGYLYVTDVGRFQVVKFDRDGHFQTAIGRLGDNLGHFARPKGIAVDRQGLLYAVDASFNNVQIFNQQGRLAMFFGEAPDKPGGFVLPAKVAIDYDNLKYFQKYLQPGFTAEYLILVTSQFGDRRVNVFAYGHEEGKHYPTDEELLSQIEERRAKERAAQQAP